MNDQVKYDDNLVFLPGKFNEWKVLEKLNYRDYDALNFIKDEFFVRWVKNPTKESSDFWEKWIASHPEKHEEIILAKSLVQTMNLAKDEQLNEQESLEILDEILAKRPGKYEKIDSGHPYSLLLKVAASIIIILLSALFLWKASYPPAYDEQLEAMPGRVVKANPPGQRSVMFLDDGSKVTLSYGSKISYPKPFKENERTVTMEGEAYFEIAHDKKRPFKVLTGNIVTEALGTSFNVNSRSGKDDIVVSLVSGKVRVGLKDKGSGSEDSEFIINPGGQISYNRKAKNFSMNDFVPDEVISWKDGVIVFSHASRTEVLSRLEAWYGVEITESNKSKSPWNLTARFDNQPLEKVLNSLSFVMKFDFETNEKKVMLKYR